MTELKFFMRLWLFCWVVAWLGSGCRSEQPETRQTLFELLSADSTGVRFVNAVQNTQNLNIFSYRNFYNGGGVAIGDINQDGLPDLFFTHNTGENALYLNTGNFRFRDITQSAGVGGRNSWSTGVVMVDLNADGLLDIYVCNAGYREGDDQRNELYINQGNLTFREHAADYGLDDNGYTTHAAFFDADQDGDLDCYILNNSFIPVNTLNYSGKRELKAGDWPVRDFLKGGGDRLLRNDNGHFVDVTEAAGIYSSLIGFGLGVTVGDINGDDLPDLYISNDFFERDYLYVNKGGGIFSEEIEKWVQHISLSSMGADMADINNDGYPEVFVTDMLPGDEYRLKTTSSFETYSVYELKQQRDFYHQYMQNTLQLNNRNGTFSEIAYFSGVAASDWSWGALMFDMDNDGYRDIYVCNGIYQDVTDQDFIDFFANDIIQKMVLTGEKEELDSVLKHMPSHPVVNVAFRNTGKLRFERMSEAWGFDIPSYSNGAAFGDLDGDGDLDLVVNNLNQPCFVFRNNAQQIGVHYLRIALRGSAPNTYAVGAKISCYTGDQIHYTEVIPSRGFQSSVDYPAHFGLGKAADVDSVVIVWPDRTRSMIPNPPIDTTLTVVISEVKRIPRAKDPANSVQSLFSQVEQDFGSVTEDDYADFYYEGLLLKKLSNEGPAICSGDVNGDGLDDLVIGGSAGSPAQIWLQAEDNFVQQESTGLERELEFEDAICTLFDADQDGDLDLFMGSGGNHVQVGDRLLQDRVYLNDGGGYFRLSASALPTNGYNTGAVLPMDYDKDGDVDLVVGSRSIPFNYGVSPISYLYRNDGQGAFSDATAEQAPGLQRLGMITDLAALDVDQDGTDELVVTGEWMAPVMFRYADGQFKMMQSGLEAYPGWWNRVEQADLDGDGHLDLVLGNRGENFYFTGSADAPVKLWLADFDDNGTVENIVTRTIDGKDMPIALKREITEQLASLKKKNLKHAEYATKSIQELLGKDAIAKAEVRPATWFASSLAMNDGNGHFTLQALPDAVQLSCVCGILCADVNADGAKDIVLGGNDYGFAPQFSRLDGSFGLTLINNGKGDFHVMDSRESGFFVKGQVRNLTSCEVDGMTYVVVGLNHEQPVLFKLESQ